MFRSRGLAASSPVVPTGVPMVPGTPFVSDRDLRRTPVLVPWDLVQDDWGQVLTEFIPLFLGDRRRHVLSKNPIVMGGPWTLAFPPSQPPHTEGSTATN